MFGSTIIKWYLENKRDLPWRNTRDPYFIWLSEIILQQTRVEQGMKYYLAFEKRFPNVKSLASAKEDQVLKLWQGLGYYSRARNLHFAAKQIMNEFGGKFPTAYNDIRSLKGVGDYTAAAIASFAYDLPYAVVDGNVYRLLSRYFGIDTPIDSTAGKKQFSEIAQSLIDGNKPSVYNQAIMEFGSQQCKPGLPDCQSCPLVQSCVAFKTKTVADLPVKEKKTSTRNRFFHYLVIKEKDSFFIRKRKEKDIWQGLHDFPLIETSKRMKENNLFNSDVWKEQLPYQYKIEKVSGEFKHILSHQLIHAKFYEINSEHKFFSESKSEWKKVNSKSVKKLAVPRLIEEYLKVIDK